MYGLVQGTYPAEFKLHAKLEVSLAEKLNVMVFALINALEGETFVICIAGAVKSIAHWKLAGVLLAFPIESVPLIETL